MTTIWRNQRELDWYRFKRAVKANLPFVLLIVALGVLVGIFSRLGGL